MDKTGRMAIIRSGIALEAAGVLGALVVLWLLTETREHGGGGGLPVQLLVAMVGCGVVEGMGALISETVLGGLDLRVIEHSPVVVPRDPISSRPTACSPGLKRARE